MKHTITFAEVQEIITRGISTFSKKDNSVRGYSTVPASSIVVGDKIIIDNYFTLVID